jgi:NAD(P)-dependent dehydrogenase (short-subunit alcohol dehydrogenase family)
VSDTTNDRPDHLAGKVILITGAGGGFGRILAEMTAAMGARGRHRRRRRRRDRDGGRDRSQAGGEAIGLSVDVTRRSRSRRGRAQPRSIGGGASTCS